MPSKAQAKYFLDKIVARFPDAEIELCFETGNAWQLLVAVSLSAQTTDKKVNEATDPLFKAFPSMHDFAVAEPEDVIPYIKTLGFFRNKSKNLVLAARKIINEYAGDVPSDRKALESIPGVGPKTAAVLVANLFGQQAIAVDTHVGRIGRRLGLTKETDPNKVERDLTALFPKKNLLLAHHALIWHGRRICHARKPNCEECPVLRKCPKIGL